MPQRIALFAASAVATILLAVGLAAAGFVPLPHGGESAAAAPDAATTAAEQAGQLPVEPETVYVKPAPKPKTIVVEKPAAAKASTPRKASPVSRTGTTRSIHRDDDESEKGEDGREREYERGDD